MVQQIPSYILFRMLTNETSSLWSCQFKQQGKIISGSNPKFDTSWLLLQLLFIYSFIWGSHKRRDGDTNFSLKSTTGVLTRKSEVVGPRPLQSEDFKTHSSYLSKEHPTTLMSDKTLETPARLAGVCSKGTVTGPAAACSFKL